MLPRENFLDQVIQLTVEAVKFPINAILQSKALIRSEEERRLLHEINHREMSLLYERMKSDECHQAVMKFLQKQRRLKKAAKQAAKL
jgi:enoyl-CoA hydratase/carnithine racemase